jgi:hypothetical protein
MPDAKKDATARAKIHLLVKATTYAHVQAVSTAKEVWSDLQIIFHFKNNPKTVKEAFN